MPTWKRCPNCGVMGGCICHANTQTYDPDPMPPNDFLVVTDQRCAERLLNRLCREIANDLDLGRMGDMKEKLPIYHWLMDLAEGEREGGE